MIPRLLAGPLRKAAERYPVVTLTGPRQSGKTTLAREVFKRHRYVSLELPEERSYALEDPRGFLARFDGPVILDEVQRAPDLFSYIQVAVDAQDQPGRFVLTGSQNFLLLESVSQSLAGRCAVLHLLPLSLAELAGRKPMALDRIGAERYRPPRRPETDADLETCLFRGGYPRIHDKGLPPRDWLANYYQTYLERDVRQVLQVGDLEAFGRFVRLCAGRSGHLLNLSSLAADTGITHTTARRWLSVLEASFIVTLLRPYHHNFGKRQVKSPKLHFLDTGLLCYLLGMREPADLHVHASRGAVFESLVVSELHKNFLNRGERPDIWFWRDSAGHEVDIVCESGPRPIPMEVKSARTLPADSLGGLAHWRSLTGAPDGPATVVYGGDESCIRSGVTVLPWWSL